VGCFEENVGGDGGRRSGSDYGVVGDESSSKFALSRNCPTPHPSALSNNYSCHAVYSYTLSTTILGDYI